MDLADSWVLEVFGGTPLYGLAALRSLLTYIGVTFVRFTLISGGVKRDGLPETVRVDLAREGDIRALTYSLLVGDDNLEGNENTGGCGEGREAEFV